MAKENKFNKISITDDFMFATVFKQNKAACKRLLESILGFEILKLEYVNDQETVNTYRESHSIRLDVIAKDSGAIYDIEMQKINDDDIMKRCRFYQGQIDTAQLLRGDEYHRLKNIYIIFICTFDLFGLDQYIYRFENYDKQLELSSDDGAKRIIINTNGHKGDITEDLKAFIDYVNSPECAKNEHANGFIKQLDNAVWENSTDDKWRLEHMKYEADVANWLRRGRAEGEVMGVEKGITIGIAEGKDEGIKAERYRTRRIFELIREGRSIDYIAADINMPKEYVKEILDLAMIK